MEHHARRDLLNGYLGQGIHEVKGWCIPQLWQVLWPLAQRIGDGPVAEIGVFEGKFLIGLAKTFGCSADNRAQAIDVFDMQMFNLDKAGVGKQEVLEANFDAHGPGRAALDCIRMDSLSLRQRDAQNLLDAHGPFAFFSVDGCHEVAHTMNDIEFAMSVISNDGIIAVDDYTNPNWPGVQEAVAKMYLMRDFAFVPLLVSCNKLLLCSYSRLTEYLNAVETYVRANHAETRMKRVRRFGYENLTVQPDLNNWQDLA